MRVGPASRVIVVVNHVNHSRKRHQKFFAHCSRVKINETKYFKEVEVLR